MGLNTGPYGPLTHTPTEIIHIRTFIAVSDSDSKEKYENKYYVGDNRLYLVLLHP